MRHTRWSLAVGAMIALATTAPKARADDVAAEALFKEGRVLLAKGRIEEACDRFKRSGALEPRVGTLLNVGECFEHTKQYASAWGAYREAANLAARVADDREGLARERAALVEKRAAWLTVSVAPLPPGATLTRNGTKIDPAILDTAIPVDPGTHDIVVTAPGRKPWRAQLELREGEARRLAVPPVDSLPAEERARPRDAGLGGGTQSKVAVGLEIGGGVVLATGLLFGGLAIRTWSSVEDACPSARCASVAERDRLDHDRSRASTFAAVSTVATLAGGAALVTGVVLHVTAPERRVSVVPAFERGGGGLVATLSL